METIGKYQVQRVLGRGGMGTVYEAVDPILHRKVALKTMIAGLAQAPDLRERFLREAQAGGGLRHRNIVTVYDLGEDKGQPYIAMELVPGSDLEKIIQNKETHPLDWKIDVISQICEGLAHAHRAGIVHRDVKPANIRVTPDGEVKIMDFGIAHLQSSTMTKSGLVLGTVHYMAPEQVEGRKIDHRADLFAVGAIAYELLAYRKPFDGESISAVMYRIMHETPDAAALPDSEYSPELPRIVLKALARDLRERYQSLDEMHEDLERLVRDAQLKRINRGEATAAPGGANGRRTTPRPLAPRPPEAAPNRGNQEMADIRAEIERARADGQLQKALALCQKVLKTSPDDREVAALAAEVEGLIREREVEQLSSMALSYAADGDFELAMKITSRIEKIAPSSPKFQQLKSYLQEEANRREAEALTGAAREHLALGNLEEAIAAAEEALKIHSGNTVAREIRERAAAVLSRSRPPAPAPTPLPVPPPAPAPRPAAAPAPAPPAPAPPPPAPAPAQITAAPAPPAPQPAAAPAAPPQSAPAPKPAAPPAPPAPKPAPAPRPAVAAAPPAAKPASRPATGAHAAVQALENSVSRPVTPRSTPAVVPPKPAAPAPQAPVAAPAPAPAPAPAAAPPPAPAPAPAPAVAPAAAAAGGATAAADPAALFDQARKLLEAKAILKAMPLLEQAATLDPGNAEIQKLLAETRPAARVAEVDALTTQALNAHMQGNAAKARKAMEKAMALDPDNKKVKDLKKILGA